jgi:hypothetical protein
MTNEFLAEFMQGVMKCLGEGYSLLNGKPFVLLEQSNNWRFGLRFGEAGLGFEAGVLTGHREKYEGDRLPTLHIIIDNGTTTPQDVAQEIEQRVLERERAEEAARKLGEILGITPTEHVVFGCDTVLMHTTSDVKVFCNVDHVKVSTINHWSFDIPFEVAVNLFEHIQEREENRIKQLELL